MRSALYMFLEKNQKLKALAEAQQLKLQQQTEIQM